jgi:hypothetical protein
MGINEIKPKTAQLSLDQPEEATVELEFKVTPLLVSDSKTRMLTLDNLSFILESKEYNDASTVNSTYALGTKFSRNPSIDMFGMI